MKEKRNLQSVLLMQARFSKLLWELRNERPSFFSESFVWGPPVMVLNRWFPWSANRFPVCSEKNEAPFLGYQKFPAYFKVWNTFKFLISLLNLSTFSWIFFWQPGTLPGWVPGLNMWGYRNHLIPWTWGVSLSDYHCGRKHWTSSKI